MECTMEYYFSCKEKQRHELYRMELEKIVSSEVNQTQKDKCHIYFSIGGS